MVKVKVIELIAKTIVEVSKNRNNYSWMCKASNSLEQLYEKLDVSNEEISDTVLKMNAPDPITISKTEVGTYKRKLVEVHYSWDRIENGSEDYYEEEIRGIDGADSNITKSLFE